MMVQISPSVSFGFPSVMSSLRIFTNLTCIKKRLISGKYLNELKVKFGVKVLKKELIANKRLCLGENWRCNVISGQLWHLLSSYAYSCQKLCTRIGRRALVGILSGLGTLGWGDNTEGIGQTCMGQNTSINSRSCYLRAMLPTEAQWDWGHRRPKLSSCIHFP